MCEEKHLLFVTHGRYYRSYAETHTCLLFNFYAAKLIDPYLYICHYTVPCMEGRPYNTYIFHCIQTGIHTLLAIDSFGQLVVRLFILFAKSYLAAANSIHLNFQGLFDEVSTDSKCNSLGMLNQSCPSRRYCVI